jgi:signal transduction histidine kinase
MTGKTNRAGLALLRLLRGAYRRQLKLALAAVGIAGTAMILGSLWWNLSLVRRGTLETARMQAGVAYEEDFVYRRWNALHGGVYVRAGEAPPRTPALAGASGHEGEAAAGMRLPLVTFSGMARQARDLSAATEHHVRARLVSLRPSRPENLPDPWERAAFPAFERGEQEASGVAWVAGREYLRLMKPLRSEALCLACHEAPGERVGGLRGAVSVAVPLAGLRALERQSATSLVVAHGALWIAGVLALLVGGRLLLRVEQARSAAEERVRQRSRELAESNRLKDLFADIMRHDLINPAGIIGYYTDHILERESDPATVDSGMKIKRTVERLTQMIHEASEFAQLREAGEIECRDIDLGGLLAETLGDLRAAGRGDDVRLRLPAGTPFPVRANPMIGNVFVNLLTNAAKYAPGPVEVGIEDHRQWWTVSVADAGDGIADADKERIFSRFERLHKEGVRGSGLGLAIARHLVELHQGRIWVEDNPGGGSVFKVRLPKAGPRPAHRDAPAPAVERTAVPA